MSEESDTNGLVAAAACSLVREKLPFWEMVVKGLSRDYLDTGSESQGKVSRLSQATERTATGEMCRRKIAQMGNRAGD
jgi:hypothetical protein